MRSKKTSGLFDAFLQCLEPRILLQASGLLEKRPRQKALQDEIIVERFKCSYGLTFRKVPLPTLGASSRHVVRFFHLHSRKLDALAHWICMCDLLPESSLGCSLYLKVNIRIQQLDGAVHTDCMELHHTIMTETISWKNTISILVAAPGTATAITD